MVRPVALLATLLFLLAGCASSPPADDAAPSPAQSTFTAVADNRLPPVMTTNMYHLLALPTVSAKAPTASEPVRIPVTSTFHATQFADQAQGQGDAWLAVLPHDLIGFMGTARIWVEVKGTLIGNPLSPVTGGCFWSLQAVAIGSGGAAGDVTGADVLSMGCLPEDVPVAPGIHELLFTFSIPERTLPAGTELHVEFRSLEMAERPPGTTVDVLTGSAEHDSSFLLYGLELPLDDALLATT